jgi:hypothetical protein
MVKKDCFAYRKGMTKRYCAALKELYCEGGECKFYKKSQSCEKEEPKEKKQ